MGRGKPETAKHERPAVQEPFEVLQCQGEHHVIAQVNALEKRLFSKSFALTGAIHQELARRNTVLLYSYSKRGSEELVLGYLVYQTNSVACHIQKLAVHPSSRNQGIAGTLLLVRSEADTRVLIVSSHRLRHGIEAALQKAVGERRVQEAVLHVAVGNAPALRLYRRLGFTDSSLVEDYYGPGRPALRMSSVLDPEANPAWAVAIAAQEPQ